MNTQNNVDYSLTYYAEWKKKDMKAYTLYNSIYMKPEVTSFWASKSLQMVIAAMKIIEAYSLEEKLWST